MKVYHYTIADRLVKIMIEGFLKLTPTEGGEYHEEGELRCVWFTTKNEWDNTAFFGHPTDVLQNAGMIRIAVETNDDFYRAVEKQDVLHNFESLAMKGFDVGVHFLDWIVTDKEVKIEDFASVELWKDEEWVAVPMINKNISIQVPVSECDIEDVFKPIVYENDSGNEWAFESDSGQNVNITFINGDGV